MRSRGFTLLLLAVAVAAAAYAAPAPTGLQADIVFDAVPARARNGELLRRLVSPLQAQRSRQALAGNPAAMQASPLVARQQRFALYVPPAPAPPAGYALLVLVPPWKDARVPATWLPALDRRHTILVTAAGSGNDADVLNRRDPLALLAAYGTMQRYPVNPAQVYVGGFSGGSRVALRLALGYPDLFRGALLDAGSDPIGSTEVPLPPAALLHRFQQSSRIAFVTGDDDLIRQAQLARTSESLAHWCVFSTHSITLLHTPHVLAGAAAIGQALAWLQQPTAPAAARMASCRTAIDARLASQLAQVRAQIAAGDSKHALHLLDQIDARYGGLAAPASIQLLQTIEAQHASSRRANIEP